MIQGSASEATLCAILAARERATAGTSNRVGAPGDLVAYATSQAHSSIEKGIRIAGIGSENLRIVPHDERFAMRPEALQAAIADDRAAGRRPFFVCATAGTTSTTAFDPVPALATICRREGLWLHVDAAMSGIAALRPELRWVNDGLDGVDSYCTNPHKWMGVNFDCDLFWVADRSALLAAFASGALAAALSLTVLKAEAISDMATGQPVVSITFDAASTEAFAAFTRDNVGKATVVRIDGEEIMRPIIREPILGGEVQISGSMTMEDAKTLAAWFEKMQVPCDGISPVELEGERGAVSDA